MDLSNLTTVATRRDLERMGVSRDRITAALRSGSLVSVAPGHYMRPASIGEFPEHEHLALARAVQAGMSPGTALAEVAAAINHGLPVVGADLSRVRLVRPGGTASGTQRTSVSVLTRNVTDDELAFVDGCLTTTVPRTVVDLARRDSVRTAVIVGDAALHRGLATPHELEHRLAAVGPMRGARRAREIVAMLDGRAESPLESWSRLVIGRSNLPSPDIQHEIRDRGRLVARVDFWWEEFGVVGECDGMGKYFGEYSEKSLREVLDEEKFRAQELVDLGYIVVRWSWDELLRRPDVVLARIERAINRARALRRVS